MTTSQDPQTSPNLVTLISIAAVAGAIAGVARDVIGHAIAASIVHADWFSASSIFAEVNTPTRIAGVCGTLVNLVLGGTAAVLVRLFARFSATWYFLWVFGCVSLMNSGRLLYSAISGTGDWTVVISSLGSPALWRVLLAVAGIFIYRPAVSFAVTAMRGLIDRSEIAYRDLWRLVLVAYLTTRSLTTAAAALRLVSESHVGFAVIGASFGLNLGMLIVPAFIYEPVQSESTITRPMPLSWPWLIFACAAAAALLAGLGRVVRL